MRLLKTEVELGVQAHAVDSGFVEVPLGKRPLQPICAASMGWLLWLNAIIRAYKPDAKHRYDSETLYHTDYFVKRVPSDQAYIPVH
jgi:hypothetical protein